MTLVNSPFNHVRLGALAIAKNPDKIVSTGENTASVDANFARNFFKGMQLDFGQYVPGSNGSDFAVCVIDREMSILKEGLNNGLGLGKAQIARTMLAMLEAIKAGDTDGNGAVSATEMEQLLAGGSLKIDFQA